MQGDMMNNIHTIINKKVIAIKSLCLDKRKKYYDADYILFDDGETYIQLEEQDYYSYHDCSLSARHINVMKDKGFWNLMMNNVNGTYPDTLII